MNVIGPCASARDAELWANVGASSALCILLRGRIIQSITIYFVAAVADLRRTVAMKWR